MKLSRCITAACVVASLGSSVGVRYDAGAMASDSKMMATPMASSSMSSKDSMKMTMGKMDEAMKMTDDAMASGDMAKMKMAMEKSKEAMMMAKKDMMAMDKTDKMHMDKMAGDKMEEKEAMPPERCDAAPLKLIRCRCVAPRQRSRPVVETWAADSIATGHAKARCLLAFTLLLSRMAWNAGFA